MKKIIILSLSVVLFLSCDQNPYKNKSFTDAEVPDWENQHVLHKNKLAPRATYFAYSSEKSAVTEEPEKTESYQDLNGVWKFNWSKNPSERPYYFFKNEYLTKNWDTFRYHPTGN